ncbi:TPA: NUDIX domain-containing protein [Candidatus Saccharibacteria bacterium]|nr:NUDIX domain-containing protein [Candidatus Saccharibacteria bacterium]HIO88041.1 NUDIX domain-containing protein [Candidatus Saccharibacteria bacterium]
MTKRHSHIAAVYMILRREDGTFPMLLRQNTGYKDNEYIVPSGHVEKDEHFSDAVVRELQEEVGVSVNKDDITLVHVSHRLVDDSDEDRLDLFYEITNWQGEVVNAEPDKCTQIGWFNEQSLPDNTYDYFKEILRFIAKGQILSEL